MSGIFKSIGAIFGIGGKMPKPQQLPVYRPTSAAQLTSMQAQLKSNQDKLAALQPPKGGGKPVDRQPAEFRYKKEKKGLEGNIKSLQKQITLGTPGAIKPLARNPAIMGGPGAEDMLKQWDQARADVERLGKAPGLKGKPVDRNQKAEKALRDAKKRQYSLEEKLINNLWQAPPQAAAPAPAPKPAPAPAPKPAPKPAPAPAPTPAPAPKPTPAPAPKPTPAPTPKPAPAPGGAPAADAAATIVGTQMIGTLGIDPGATPRGGGGGPRSRRGRVATLLGGGSGDSPERFGG